MDNNLRKKILKEINFSGKFLNIASSEIFGNQKGFKSLNKKLKPISPYGKAKLKSFNLTKNFRKVFGLKTYNGILFNCESILRPKKFVIPKICLSAIKAFKGYKRKIKFGDINVVRDWGWVEEYAEGIYKITQKKPDDIIIATGKSFKLRDLIKSFSFDKAFILHQSCRYALICKLAGIKNILGYGRNFQFIFLSPLIFNKNFFNKNFNIYEEALNFTKKIDIIIK